MENGTVKKDDGTGIHVNPMFNTGSNNKTPHSATNSNPASLPGNDKVSSLPSTPSRSRTLSEPKSGTPRRFRANSTGNVSRSHERHHSQGMTDYSDERIRLPRHLSAGNVSHHHRQGSHSDHASQNQSPARTLPRQRAATGNAPFSPSSARNPHNWPSSAHTTSTNGMSNSGINNTSQPQSPARSVQRGVQHPSASGTLNNRQQIPGSEFQHPSNFTSAQYNSLGHGAKQLGAGNNGRDGEANFQGNPLSRGSGDAHTTPSPQHSMSYQRANSATPIKSSNPSNTLASDSNSGAPMPYSNHRTTPNLSRKWSEEKPTNEAVPNITTNLNYSSKPGDIWHKHNGVKSELHDENGRSLSEDQGSTPGSFLQRRNFSSEKCSSQGQDANKGTLRPPSTGELLSPLDVLPDTYANNSSLRLSDQRPYNITPGTSSFHPFPPPPPEIPTDSSDDDLYSIVAKGNYSSAVPDPNLRHSGVVRSDKRERKQKNKHVYVIIPSEDGSTAV